MSRYINLDEATDLFRGIDATMVGSFVADTLENLPTIEVSDEKVGTSQETSTFEDAISREYILERANEWFSMYPDSDTAREAITMLLNEIDNAPSVVPQPKEGEWIPCSERLPSERGDYLVTFPLCDGEPCVYMLSFNKGKFYETDDEWGDFQYVDVTAWMPLPEPWKGASDE